MPSLPISQGPDAPVLDDNVRVPWPAIVFPVLGLIVCLAIMFFMVISGCMVHQPISGASEASGDPQPVEQTITTVVTPDQSPDDLRHGDAPSEPTTVTETTTVEVPGNNSDGSTESTGASNEGGDDGVFHMPDIQLRERIDNLKKALSL